ncbi:hypothetical protein KK141_07660 [Dyella sp. LX-66]|uniref:helix-turn-helix domain-containing transcriptional regulator n=1 Tax=unclassified Dyella TaxID=2634549 RepID=UPI001BE08E02|nr:MULTISPECIES: hypothetical protein [unclassified Dyella]MBT2115590.1 hypothetical protein [Dyella sp. LX-1]MBT2139405.1 hypothetical protein [Dyella sp. LX-66]
MTEEKLRIAKYDVAEHLRTPEEIALYLEACVAESDGDNAFIAKALGNVARAQSAGYANSDCPVALVTRKLR